MPVLGMIPANLAGNDDCGVTPVTVGDKPHGYHWMPYCLGQAAKAEELV
jgi:hypothetical protein